MTYPNPYRAKPDNKIEINCGGCGCLALTFVLLCMVLGFITVMHWIF